MRTVGSYGEVFSYEQGTPVVFSVLPIPQRASQNGPVRIVPLIGLLMVGLLVEQVSLASTPCQAPERTKLRTKLANLQ